MNPNKKKEKPEPKPNHRLNDLPGGKYDRSNLDIEIDKHIILRMLLNKLDHHVNNLKTNQFDPTKVDSTKTSKDSTKDSTKDSNKNESPNESPN